MNPATKPAFFCLFLITSNYLRMFRISLQLLIVETNRLYLTSNFFKI